jgi:hypothetical protein
MSTLHTAIDIVYENNNENYIHDNESINQKVTTMFKNEIA